MTTDQSAIQPVTVPNLGDFHDVDVIEVLVKSGDRVEAGASLITLETDKAAMDVPAPFAGIVRELRVKTGAKVSQGDAILTLETAASPPPKTQGDQNPPPAKSRTAPVEPTPAQQGDSAASQQADPKPAEKSTPQLVSVPNLGDFHDVDIIEVLVKSGDRVEAGASLITLETDKAAMDVPAPFAGIVRELRVKTGAKVSQGHAIAMIEPSADPTPAQPRAPDTPPPPVSRPDTPHPEPARPSRSETRSNPTAPGTGRLKPYAGPAVRKLARELGVDLARLSGSGTRGRILALDIQTYVRRALEHTQGGGMLPEVPVYDYSRFGEIERQPLTRIQKISGPRLVASWLNIPHVTQHDQIDITEVDALRVQLNQGEGKRYGIKLTLLPFVMKAAVQALQDHPVVNASLDVAQHMLIIKKYFHLGFAVDTPEGLVVPVLRDVNRKNLWTLAREISTLADKARKGALTASDFQGGCFTISSLGGIGGTGFTPIINAPEVAILGVSRAELKPVWREGRFVPRLLLPLSLSYDHRVIDGARAVRFTRTLAEALERYDGVLDPPD
ncbi:MAG: dihydrolipoyllysine-residue acetyltransferase [Gammaproteobacteria bacterium]